MTYMLVRPNVDERESVWHIDLSAGVAAAQVWPKRDISIEWEDGTTEVIPKRTRCTIGTGTSADFTSLFYYIVTGQGAPTSPILVPITDRATLDIAVPNQPWGMMAVCGKWGSAPYWPLISTPTLTNRLWIAGFGGGTHYVSVYKDDLTEDTAVEAALDAYLGTTTMGEATGVLQLPSGEVWLTDGAAFAGGSIPGIYRVRANGTMSATPITNTHFNQLGGMGIVNGKVIVVNGSSAAGFELAVYNFDGTLSGYITPYNWFGSVRTGLRQVDTHIWLLNGEIGIDRLNTDGSEFAPPLEPFTFNFIQGITLVNADIWVTVQGTNQVHIYNSSGTLLNTLTGNGLNIPWGVVWVQSIHEVWVVNSTSTPTFSRFHEDGTSAGSPVTISGASSPAESAAVAT